MSIVSTIINFLTDKMGGGSSQKEAPAADPSAP
jgi:hypothetical protein